MVDESRRRGGAGRALRVRGLALACCGCAQVLGIPTDPQLVPPAAPPLAAMGADSGSADGVINVPIVTPVEAETPGSAGTSGMIGPGRDGVLPADGVGGIVSSGDASAQHDAGTIIGVDAGPADVADAGHGGAGCVAEPAAIDVIFAVDNSGSMAEECEAFEQALPDFVGRLSGAGVDYRVIVVSRHRQDERGVDGEANTSVCISAPVSGLATCPSASPALSARFFHHSIKLDASDSLERLLESLGEPDPFGLNASGWSEWLRPAARKIFVEITDADSDMSASDFSSALAAASPEHFGAGTSSFVFHAVLGIAESTTDGGAYGAGAPIELERCSGPGSSIDSAGPVYQQLSRATGGLRLSICPPSALGERLQAVADDAVARSGLVCPG